MNVKIIILLSLVIIFPAMLFANNSLAVLPFGYANEYTQMTIAQNLTDSVENWMVEFGVFKVVERNRLKDLIKEQKLSLAGFIDPKTAVNIGKLVGAQYVSFGAVTNVKFNDDGTVSNISATMKVVNTTTGIIVYSAHSSIDDLSSSNLINDLAMDLSLKICSGITGKRVILPMNLRWERYGNMVWAGLITSALTIPGVMDDFWTSMAYAEGYDPSVGTSTQYILFVGGLVTSGYGISKIYIIPDVYQPTVNRKLFGYNRICISLINTKF
jgi:hypothetical protein